MVSSVATTAQAQAKAEVEEEFEAIVSGFERASLTLPPSEASLRRFAQQSLDLSKRIRRADFRGKGSLLRHLQRFCLQLRQMRAARRRFLSGREEFAVVPSSPFIWQTEEIGLKRNPLYEAIHAGGLGSEAAPAVRRTAALPAASNQFAISMQATKLLRARLQGRIADAAAPATEGSHASTRSVRIDPILAIEGRLALADRFERAREVAVGWLQSKGVHVGDSSLDSFELESRDGKNRAIAIVLEDVWALQVESVDQALPGRKWRVEMVLVDAQPTAAVGVRSTAISPADLPAPPPSMPGLVSELIEKIGLLEADAEQPLFAGPTEVDKPSALNAMLQSLQSPRRRKPALVLSKYMKDGKQSTLLDPTVLAHQLRGVAKVYVLSREMSWGLTHALSKRFAVAGAAVRMFRPGFTADDEPSSHPLWDPSALQAQGSSLSSLTATFLREATEASLGAIDRDDAVPSFDRIREKVLRKQIEEARDFTRGRTKVDSGSDAAVHALEAQLKDEAALRTMFEEENIGLDRELRQLRSERDTLLAQMAGLRAQNRGLKNRIKQLERSPVDAGPLPGFPDSWDDLEDWCEQYLGKSVAVTTKAIRSARDSDFEDIPFAYEVLFFLSTSYAAARRGEVGGERLEAEKTRLRIEVSPVGRGAEERRSKDTYSTMYKNERVPLDMHVKGSNDKNPKYGFRLYFHWHEVDQRVVVGWFPSHLDNGMS